MVNQRRLDIIGALVCTGMGIAFAISSMKYLDFHVIPNAGFFPFLGGSCLTGLSLISLTSALMKKEKGKEELFFPERFSLKRLLILVSSVIGYDVAIEYLGFPLVTFLFMIFLLRVLERKKWPTAFAASFLTMAVSYMIFQVLLGVRLPSGILYKTF